MHDVFSGSNISLQFDRPRTKIEYRELLHQLWDGLSPPPENSTELHCNNPDNLVLFIQSDDHMFVDFDNSVLITGLELMQADSHAHRGLYLSHWPEVLRLAGKMGDQRMAGSDYVVFDALYALYLFLSTE